MKNNFLAWEFQYHASRVNLREKINVSRHSRYGNVQYLPYKYGRNVRLLVDKHCHCESSI